LSLKPNQLDLTFDLNYGHKDIKMTRCGVYHSGIAALCLLVALFCTNCSSGSSSTDIPTSTNDGGSAPASPVACQSIPAPTGGNTFYLDPVNGRNDNAGTIASPWSSLQSVVEDNMIETRAYTGLPYDGTNALAVKNPGAPVKAGDTLVLLDGYHGEFYLRGAYNEHPITIEAAVGYRPTLSRIFLSAGANWHFKGLVVSPSEAPIYSANTLVTVESHSWHGPSSHVVIDNCELYSVPESSAWSLADWNTLACNAIQVSGDCMTIRDNTSRNVDFGISVSGNSALVSGNLVENFAGDGMRGLGNDMVFEYNVVKNCYDVNANHDDGFQSWSINDDPPRYRVVLRGNTFINYEDPDQPFRGTLQGIGCFDGFYIDWVIENNLVLTDHWHGISLYGAVNCRIVNNTVVDLNDASPGPPWILVNAHKDGTPSQGCVIRNNIAATITATGDTASDHNLLLTDRNSLFVNPALVDFHLRPEAHEAIDTGSDLLAPVIDMDGVARPQGGGIDLGCYEGG
jgi:parallel beta-helix repeat protein